MDGKQVIGDQDTREAWTTKRAVQYFGVMELSYILIGLWWWW